MAEPTAEVPAGAGAEPKPKRTRKPRQPRGFDPTPNKAARGAVRQASTQLFLDHFDCSPLAAEYAQIKSHPLQRNHHSAARKADLKRYWSDGDATSEAGAASSSASSGKKRKGSKSSKSGLGDQPPQERLARYVSNLAIYIDEGDKQDKVVATLKKIMGVPAADARPVLRAQVGTELRTALEALQGSTHPDIRAQLALVQRRLSGEEGEEERKVGDEQPPKRQKVARPLAGETVSGRVARLTRNLLIYTNSGNRQKLNGTLKKLVALGSLHKVDDQGVVDELECEIRALERLSWPEIEQNLARLKAMVTDLQAVSSGDESS